MHKLYTTVVRGGSTGRFAGEAVEERVWGSTKVERGEMLHLTSANCTHLPAEGYAGVKRGHRGGEEESREQGWQWGNSVRSRYTGLGRGGFVRLSDSGCIDRATCMCYIPPGPPYIPRDRTSLPLLSLTFPPVPHRRPLATNRPSSIHEREHRRPPTVLPPLSYVLLFLLLAYTSSSLSILPTVPQW